MELIGLKHCLQSEDQNGGARSSFNSAIALSIALCRSQQGEPGNTRCSAEACIIWDAHIVLPLLTCLLHMQVQSITWIS